MSWPLIGLNRRVTYLVARNRQIRLAFHSELKAESHVEQACSAAREAATLPG